MDYFKIFKGYHINSYEIQHILTYIFSGLILIIFNDYELYSTSFLILSSIGVFIIGIVFYYFKKFKISLYIVTVSISLCIICILKYFSIKPEVDIINTIGSTPLGPMVIIIMLILFLLQIIMNHYMKNKYISLGYSVLMITAVVLVAIFVEKKLNQAHILIILNSYVYSDILFSIDINSRN